MRRHMETEIKVGIFVSIGVGLTMLAVLLMGGAQSLFTRSNTFTSHFTHVDGLIVGSKVILNGVPVGAVDSIDLDKASHSIRVAFSVAKDSSDWIRKDSTAEIATQGVLGDKYISIESGSPDQPTVPSGSDIPNRPSNDISQFFNQGDQLLSSLNSVAKSLNRILKSFEGENRSEIFFKGMTATAGNLSKLTDKLNRELDQIQLKSAIGSLAHIFEKINNGTGTIGALVNDPGLYDDVKALVGGANRNRIIRNLVRQTIKESKEKEPESTPILKQK